MRPEPPAEAGPPQEVEHRLVVLEVRPSHEGVQDHPRLAAVDGVVGLVAHLRGRLDVAGQAGVGVGPAHDLVAALGTRIGDTWGRPAPAGGRNEVVAGAVGGEELGVSGRGQGGVGKGKLRDRRGLFLRIVLEQPLDVPDHLEPRHQRLPGRVGLHRGRVEEQLIAFDQPRLDAQLHDPLEEAAEDLEAVALADARERGVVGQGLVQVVAEVPPERDAVGDHPHEPAFGA